MFEQEYTRANDRIHPRKDLLKEMEAKWAAEAEKPAEETGKVIPFPSWIRYAAVAAPILAAGDITGAVCLIQPETGAAPNEGDVKLAQVAAAFLGKQMEN